MQGIMFLVLLVTRKRLGLVIRLFEEAGRAISDMPTLLILPWVVSFFIP
jgi:Plasma-membrane choline transporter